MTKLEERKKALKLLEKSGMSNKELKEQIKKDLEEEIERFKNE